MSLFVSTSSQADISSYVILNCKVYVARLRVFYESDLSSDNWLAYFIFLLQQGTARGNTFGIRDRNLVRVDMHFRWQQFLRHIPPLLSLSLSPLYFPSLFSFSFPFSCWFMLLVWLWRTLGFALGNGIVPGLRNVFDGGYGSRADERSYQMSHRMARTRSFHLSHVAQNVQTITRPWY